jgi:hypothetical protein
MNRRRRGQHFVVNSSNRTCGRRSSRDAATDGRSRGSSLLNFGNKLVGKFWLLIQKRLFALNFFLQANQSFQQRFRTRRASRNVNVHRDKLIDALQHGITAIHPAARCARAHGDAPFRFWHLLPNTLYGQRHFVSNGAGDNHDIALPRRESHYLGTETCDIEARSCRRHQFNCATGQTHRHGPERILAHPVHGSVELCENDVALNF